jgi:hypothetical protein
MWDVPMQKALLTYVMALGIGALAAPAGSWAAFENEAPLSVTAAPLAMPARFASAQSPLPRPGHEPAVAVASLGRRASLWASHSRSGLDLTSPFAVADGDRATESLGIEYLFGDGLVAGLGFGVESPAMGGAFADRPASTGVSGVGYAAFAINRHLSVDASVGYAAIADSHSRHVDAAPASRGGPLDGPRVFGAASLNGAYNIDRWGFSGKLGYLRSHSPGSGSGNGIGVHLAKISIGGKVAYSFARLLPYVTAYLVWDHDLTRAVVGPSEAVRPYENTDIMGGGGFTFRLSKRLSGGLGATTTFGRASFTNTTVRGNVRFVF